MHILLLIFFFTYNQKVQAFEHQNPVILELKVNLKNNGYYAIKIHENGKVHYQENIKKENNTLYKAEIISADYYSKITENQVKELVNYFLRLPFHELPKYEEKRSEDTPRNRSVHLKLWYVQIDIKDNIIYRALLTQIKRYIEKDLKTWLCFPPGHKDYINNCPEYMYLPENFKF